LKTYTPEQHWVDVVSPSPYPHVRAVWRVRGPVPFGGLECCDEEHARAVCEHLNADSGQVPSFRSDEARKLWCEVLLLSVKSGSDDPIADADSAVSALHERVK
jgi:hypothetical protein